jgi:hypothetical protein
MKTFTSLLVLLAAVGTAGCHDPSSPDLTPFKDLHIELTPSALTAGDTARVLFRNAGPTQLYVNSCGSHLERELFPNHWQEVSSTWHPNCADLVLGVRPGGERLGIAGVIPGSAAAGTYRYRIGIVGYERADGSTEQLRLALTPETFVVQ